MHNAGQNKGKRKKWKKQTLTKKSLSEKKKSGKNFGQGNLNDKNIEITHIAHDTYLELLASREKGKISTGEFYPYCIEDTDKSRPEKIVLRINLENEEKAENFKNRYSVVSNTNWIIYGCTPNPQRFVFSKTWICNNSKRHKQNARRNADCKAKLSIVIKKITKGTKEKDKYLKYDIPLDGEVKISLLHSHNTTSAETLRMLRGTTVKVHEDHLWAVLLVTPLMKRNHLFSSKEIIFIDSTSSCEASSSTITILLSATKVGALPLAVMIHASQSIQNYINAFQLLKMNFPQCFGGQDVIYQNLPNHSRGPRCLSCNLYGHKSFECRRANLNNTSTPPSGVNAVYELPSPINMFKDVTIFRRKLNGLVDTGSNLTLLRNSTYINIDAPPLKQTNTLTGFGFSRINVIGTFDSEITIDDQIFPVTISVVPNSFTNYDLIIGCDVIKQAHLNISPTGVKFAQILRPSDNAKENFIMTISDGSPTFDVGPNVSQHNRAEVEQLLSTYTPKNKHCKH
ncbi:SWIM-type domain-containing protein [Trichonephila clavipes]|nr:SWIM-type domain-containing protein [Trichonephila clavipes]